MKKIIFFIIASIISVNAFALDIKSGAFENKGYIPDRYTCDAQNFSPYVYWKDIPSKAKSLVLICDDPDAPFKIWVHWVVFNIPVKVKEFKENIGREGIKALEAVEGLNDSGILGYKGPCPPAGKAHRYIFSLYALDITLNLKEGATKNEVVEAMKGHIIAEAKTTGLYQR